MLPTTGDSALRVAEVLAHDATWMPSGNSILFAAGNRLGIVNLDTGAETTYVSLSGRAFWARAGRRMGARYAFTLMDPVMHSSSRLATGRDKPPVAPAELLQSDGRWPSAAVPG